MGNQHGLLWLILVAIFVICAYWQVSENRKMILRWQRELDAVSAEKMAGFAWMRTGQLLIGLAAMMILILMYDKHLGQANQEINALEKFKADIEEKEAPKLIVPNVNQKALILPQSPPTIPKVEAPPTLETRVVGPSVDSGGSGGAAGSAGAAEVPAPPGAASALHEDLAKQADVENTQGMLRRRYKQPDKKAATSNGQSVEDVYNPESKNQDNASRIDEIKMRYENILVTHMFLKKCNRANDSDYATITGALSKEMQATGAPGNLQNDIQTAAQGSYNEIYAKSPCDGPTVEALSQQYSDYIKALAQTLRAH